MAKKPQNRTPKLPDSDILPTPERTLKPDYEWQDGKRVKLNTLRALANSGDISGEAESAAKWWLCDFIFYTFGRLDIMGALLPDDYTPGDIHTFAISRGKAGERIGMVKAHLGTITHDRLVMLLVEEMSFTEMGRILFPNKGTDARKHATAQCALILEQLAPAYTAVRRQLKARKQKNRELATGVKG